MKTKTKLTLQIAGMYLGYDVEIEKKAVLNPNYTRGKLIGIIKEKIDINDDRYSIIKHSDGQTLRWSLSDIKLILRSIEDMTEEEYYKWELLDIAAESDMEDIMTKEAMRTAWLIKNRYDAFNLIASGCAVRKQK